MGARRLHHDAKGGDAPVALFDVRDAFENARLRFGDRLHPLELDLRRRLHQQLHSSDPGRRATAGQRQVVPFGECRFRSTDRNPAGPSLLRLRQRQRQHSILELRADLLLVVLLQTLPLADFPYD